LERVTTCIEGAAAFFAYNGNFSNESTKEFLKSLLLAFGKWVDMNGTKPPNPIFIDGGGKKSVFLGLPKRLLQAFTQIVRICPARSRIR
jgi:hypothetical protein